MELPYAGHGGTGIQAPTTFDLLTLVKCIGSPMDHHLVAHGSLVVVEEASTSITRFPEVDQDHLIC